MRVLFLLLFSLKANSLIIKLSDMHMMAKNSDVIIHGYIGEQRVSKDDFGRLVTLTDVEVIDALQGAKTGQVITIYQVGGQKDGQVMPIVGGQKYILGQQVLFFGLKLDNAYVNFGAGQGKLDIDNELVKEDLGDVHSIKKESNGDIKVYKPEPLIYQGVDELKNEIRTMLK